MLMQVGLILKALFVTCQVSLLSHMMFNRTIHTSEAKIDCFLAAQKPALAHTLRIMPLSKTKSIVPFSCMFHFCSSMKYFCFCQVP